VRKLRVGGQLECDALAQAGLLGDLAVLDATLALGPTGSAKATEVVEAVLEAGFPHKAVRLQLLAGDSSPLDIASLRTTPKGVEAALAPA
jgi:hypothetical protein